MHYRVLLGHSGFRNSPIFRNDRNLSRLNKGALLYRRLRFHELIENWMSWKKGTANFFQLPILSSRSLA